jgi:uncharacterized membrane protein YphA (DoxX/SURF4 family)
MQSITRLNRWANAHTNVFTDGLRIIFGGFIFFKGLYFLDNIGYLDHILRIAGGKGNYFFVVRYVALAHLCGGLLIVLGLVTRLAALVQLPILVGAVTVNFIGAMDHSSFLQSLASFFTCAFFLFYGSGKHSLDKAWRLHV